MILWALWALLAALGLLGTFGALAAASTLRRAFRSGLAAQPAPPGPLLPLSMLVPIKGADAHTEAHLEALVTSALDGEVEYLFAMEAEDDPAYAVCQRVIARHPERAARVVITGPAGGRMGKQHNLAVALHEAHYEAIGSMDADVLVEPDTLAVALGALNAPDAGVVYFLPCYQGPGPVGGALVALYTNYYFAPNMGALARIGGLEQFSATVSDDAAIGKAVAKAGRTNTLLPRAVRIPYEPVGLWGGARHLLKWLAMLRAEGLGTYLLILFTWHPVLWGVLAVLGATMFGSVPHIFLFDYAIFAGLTVVSRVGSAFLLNRAVYHQRGLALPLLLIPYELVAVPVLFAIGLFRHSIVWRGRRYRLGRHGVILASADAS